MQLTTVIVLSLLASLVNASPTLLQPREDIDAHSADSCPWCNDYDGHGWGWGSGSNYEACSNGLYSQADCCDVDIAGVIALSCSTVSEVPRSPDHFQATCARSGKQAKCCALGLLSSGVLCDTPVGL